MSKILFGKKQESFRVRREVSRRRDLVTLTLSICSVTVKIKNCRKSESYIFRRHCLHSENENTQSQNTKAKQAYSVAR